MKRFILFFACLTSISLVAAQEVLNWKDDEIVSPVVNADNSLTISLFAPNARRLNLQVISYMQGRKLQIGMQMVIGVHS